MVPMSNATNTVKNAAICEIHNARQWADVVVSCLNRGERGEARIAKGRAIACAKKAADIVGKRKATWAVDIIIKAEDFIWHDDCCDMPLNMWRALAE